MEEKGEVSFCESPFFIIFDQFFMKTLHPCPIVVESCKRNRVNFTPNNVVLMRGVDVDEEGRW